MYAKPLSLVALPAGLFIAAALSLAVGPEPARAAIRQTGTWPGQPAAYNDYHEAVLPAQPLPAVVTAPPVKYTIAVTPVPLKAGEVEADRVVLMAHVPENARVWVEGNPTTSTGKEQLYESPPLTSDKKYEYLVRVAWAENGHWVSKEASIPVQAGQMQCFFLRKAVTPAEQAAEAKANLAKLPPEDRKLAEAQKFCVVESETLLGAVGVPVKVMVKGQPVFLCCKACLKQATADSDKTLAKVKELKAKASAPPPK